MAAQSLLAKLGVRFGTLGTSSSLAMAFPLSEGNPDNAAHTAATRTGWYGVEGTQISHVVNGTEVLTVGASRVTAAVPVSCPASTTTSAPLNIGQGTAPTSPVNGDLWVTSGGFFVRIAGSTVGPFSSNPMTTLGDTVYGGNSGVPTRLAGNTSTVNMFWTQQGTGTVSAAPGWNLILAGDVPNLPATIITSGVLTATYGGTGVNASTAANGTLFIGTGSGLALTTLTQGSGIVITNGPGTITIAATGGGGGTTFLDNAFAVQNVTDPSKQFELSLGGMTTATVLTLASVQTTSQTLTVPNLTAGDTVATLGLLQTFTATKIHTGILAINGTGSITAPRSGSGSQNEFFGSGAGNSTLTGSNNVALGAASAAGLTNGSYNVLIGRGAGGLLTQGVANIYIGYGADNSAAPTQSNTAIIGSPDTGHYIANFYLGAGQVNATPTNTIVNATGGSGSNVAGASLGIAGGQGTGTAAGGSITLQVAGTGSSGSTLNALATIATVAFAGVTMASAKLLTTAASATGGAGFNIPQGTAPSAPNNGDIWTTTTGMFARINGSTVGPFSSGGGGGSTFLDNAFAVQNSTDATKQVMFSLGGMTTAKILTFASVNTTTATLNIPNVATGDTLATLGIANVFTAAQTVGITGSSTASLTVNAVTAGTTSGITFSDGGTAQWSAYKETDNTLHVLDSVHGVSMIVLTAGNTVNGKVVFKNTGSASSATTGAVQIVGGLGIGGSVFIANSLTISGTTAANGELLTIASNTTNSGLNIPHGTAPTSPVNGDFWSTTAGFFGQVNGSTVGPFTTGGGGGSVFLDNAFAVQNSTTTTKQVEFSLAGSTASTILTIAIAQSASHTLNLPNISATDTVATLGIANAFTGANTWGTVTNPIAITQAAATSGAPPTGFSYIGGAHTGLTTGTATPAEVVFNGAQTKQWTGTTSVTNYRFMEIDGPIMAATAATTFTSPATLWVNGPPTTGTNATVSAPYSLYVNSGNILFKGTLTMNMSGQNILVTQAATSSTAATNFQINSGTMSNITASAEVIDVNFNLSHTIGHATGALATQRSFLIQAPTLTFVGASTVTTAATVAISGAPIASTNATITSSYALWIQLGTTAVAASTTTGASINMAPGTAPTSPVNGDLWATTAGVFAQVNGVTVGPFSSGGGGGSTFLDNAFAVQNSTTPTKQFEFNLAGQTASTILTLTTAQSTSQILNVPNITATDTLVTLGTTSTFTANIVTAATSTTIAGLNLPAGAAPTSPVNGDLWNDSTQHSLTTQLQGQKTYLLGTMYNSTAVVTIGNTVTQTSMFSGTAVGVKTMANAYSVVGKSFRMTMTGVMSAAATLPTLNIQIMNGGSNVLLNTGNVTLIGTGGFTNVYFRMDIIITCHTTGGAGSAFASGQFSYDNGTTVTVLPMSNASTVTFSTNSSLNFDALLTWGTAATANTISIQTATIETLA